MTEGLWPYLVVIAAGFLPNEAFRAAAVLLARRVDETSELFTWIRIVAIALLAAVVSKLTYSPAAMLAAVPLWLRILSIAVGVAAFFSLRRALLTAILAGEAVFVTVAWWLGAR